MDLGVGSFVFSQSVVSAMQLIKDSAYLISPVVSKFIRDSQIVWVSIFFFTPFESLFVYKEHETEYGRHWNFFITLALLPIIQVLLHHVLLHLPIALVRVVVSLSTNVS